MSGNSIAVFTQENGFDSIPADPDWYRPGYETSVSLNISNNLQRLMLEDDVEPDHSVEGNWNAEFTVSYAMNATNYTQVRSAIFNDGGAGFTSGTPAMSRWLIGHEFVNESFGTDVVELEMRACIPRSYRITYEQKTNTIQEELTMGAGNMDLNTAYTAGDADITGPTPGATSAFHNHSLTLDSSTVNRDQSITLEFPNIATYGWESSRTPTTAYQNQVPPTLTSTVEYHTNDYVGLGLSGGDTTATAVQDEIGNVSGSWVFSERDGTTAATYTFSNVSLNDYSGDNWITSDNSATGQANWNVDGGVSVS